MGRERRRLGMDNAAEHGRFLLSTSNFDFARVAIALAVVHENSECWHGFLRAVFTA
jgi:hypothetical protein